MGGSRRSRKQTRGRKGSRNRKLNKAGYKPAALKAGSPTKNPAPPPAISGGADLVECMKCAERRRDKRVLEAALMAVILLVMVTAAFSPLGRGAQWLAASLARWVVKDPLGAIYAAILALYGLGMPMAPLDRLYRRLR